MFGAAPRTLSALLHSARMALSKALRDPETSPRERVKSMRG
jgi:hypothetical protein